MFRIPREAVNISAADPLPEEKPVETESRHEEETESLKSDITTEPVEAEKNDDETIDYETFIDTALVQYEMLCAQIEAKRQELSDIVELANAEASAIRAEAEANAVEIADQSRDLGYAEGRAAAESELREQRSRDAALVNKALKEIGAARVSALAKQESDIIDFCFDLIKKLYGTDFERGNELLIEQALKKLGADLEDFKPLETVFDYNGETIDASFETQLRKLRDEFGKIS